MSIEIENLDREPVIMKMGSFFYLWCCDCKLRHIVFVDKAKDKDSVKIGLVRDDMATANRRKLDKIVLYQRKSKNVKTKSNSNT
jgi:hypothetical protein